MKQVVTLQFMYMTRSHLMVGEKFLDALCKNIEELDLSDELKISFLALAIKAGMESFAAGLAKEVTILGAAFTQFGQAYYQMAEKYYLDVNGRLPGSMRTKRLRKKRQKRVLDWFGWKLKTMSLPRSEPATPGQRALIKGVMLRQGQGMIRSLRDVSGD